MSVGGQASFSRWAFVAALGAFLLIGALGAAYGPLLRTISLRFGVSLPTAGTVLSVHFAGALAGVLGALTCLRGLSGRAVMTGALAILAFGCAGVAASRDWLTLLGSVLLTGTGFGALPELGHVLALSTSAGR